MGCAACAHTAIRVAQRGSCCLSLAVASAVCHHLRRPPCPVRDCSVWVQHCLGVCRRSPVPCKERWVCMYVGSTLEEGTAPCLAIAVRALNESSMWKSGRHIHSPTHFFIFNFLKGQYFCSTSHAILYVQYIHRHTCTCMQSLAQLNLDLRIHPSPHCIMYMHLFYFTSFSTYGTGIACEWSERFRPSEWHLASTDSKHEKYPFEQEPHLNAGGTGLSPSPREAFHRCLPERCTYST